MFLPCMQNATVLLQNEEGGGVYIIKLQSWCMSKALYHAVTNLWIGKQMKVYCELTLCGYAHA